MKKSFFLVEDHSLMRQGITSYLAKNSNFDCVGVASSGKVVQNSWKTLHKTIDTI